MREIIGPQQKKKLPIEIRIIRLCLIVHASFWYKHFYFFAQAGLFEDAYLLRFASLGVSAIMC